MLTNLVSQKSHDQDATPCSATALAAKIFKKGPPYTFEDFFQLTESDRNLLKDQARKRDPMIQLTVERPALYGCKVLTKQRSTQMQGQQKPKKGKRRGGKYPPQKGHDAIGTPRSLLPDEIDVELPWVYTSILTNPGLAYASLRYIANGCYDPDPQVGGTSFIGISEWALFYGQYRVLSYHWKVEISNREAFPMFVDFYNLNLDPSGSVGSVGVLYSMNPFGKTVPLGALGSGESSATVSGFVPLAKIFGSEMVETSPLFAGFLLGANPSSTIWFGFNTRSAVVQTAAGAFFTVSLRARVRLFDRAPVTV
jgi:hypothetical protein